MPISVVFDPPLPSDSPSTFNTKAFTLLGDLNDWSTQANALPGEVATNLTTLLAAPPAIGSTTPAAVSATTLSASGGVVGAGFKTAESGFETGKFYRNATLGTIVSGSSGSSKDLTLTLANGATALDIASTGAVTIPGSFKSGAYVETPSAVVFSGTAQNFAQTADGAANKGIVTIDSSSTVQLLIGSVPATPYGMWLQTKDRSGSTAFPLLLNAAGGAVTIGNSSSAVTIPGGITQESVIAPTLLNSWVNYGGVFATAGYWKDTFGVVHFQGSIKSGTTAASTNLFTLPAGYRPSAVVVFPVLANTSMGGIYVDTSGNVVVQVAISASITSLDGISFKV